MATAAEEIYRRAIGARPRYWASYDAYGTYLVSEGRPGDAVVQYRRATELMPGNATVHSNLGAAYFLLGDFENAGAAFRRSVELAPTGEGYSNTATQYYFAGRYDDVVYAIDTASGAIKTIKVGREPHGLTVWPQPGRYSLGHTGNMR